MGNLRELKYGTTVMETVIVNGNTVDLVKLNGVTYFRTNDSPTITYITKTSSSITFRLTNPNISPRRVFYKIGGTPSGSSYDGYVDLAADTMSSNIVLSGLSGGTNYTLYANCYMSDELDYSTVSSYNFTTISNKTATPTVAFDYYYKG